MKKLKLAVSDAPGVRRMRVVRAGRYEVRDDWALLSARAVARRIAKSESFRGAVMRLLERYHKKAERVDYGVRCMFLVVAIKLALEIRGLHVRFPAP